MKSKGKVVLVYPEFDPPIRYWYNKSYTKPYPPYSIVSIGGYLKKKGYEVKIIDALMYENYKDLLLKECKNAIAVGLSVMTLQVKDALEVSKIVRGNSDAKIVWGGVHPNLYPIQTSKDTLVDFVVLDEGEGTMYQLLEAIRKNISKSEIKKINGLAFDNIITPKRKKMDLDDLPFCDYTILNENDYLPGRDLITRKKIKKLLLESARGCPHRCAFCINVLFNNYYRFRSVDKVVKEIDRAVKKYNINFVQFWDENFFANKKRVKKFCEEILKKSYKIRWAGHCRADYFRKGILDDKLLKLCKKAGLIRVDAGVESGSEKILKLMKKDIVPEDAIIATKKCKAVGVQFSPGFMFGVPGETKRDIYETIRLIKKLRKIDPEMNGGVAVYRPYPGNEFYEQIKNMGIYKEPRNLREWAKRKYSSIMCSDVKDVPWSKHSRFIVNASHYTTLAFIPNYLLWDHIKEFKIPVWGYVFFSILAKIRMHLNFFGLAFDKFLYLYLKKKFS